MLFYNVMRYPDLKYSICFMSTNLFPKLICGQFNCHNSVR